MPASRGREAAEREIARLLRDPDAVLLHPSEKTLAFAEILAGKWIYTEGQGVYNSVKSAEVVKRQLQAALLRDTLASAVYRDLKTDWDRHARAAAAAWGESELLNEDPEAARVAFETWAQTLAQSLLEFAHETAAGFVGAMTAGEASFDKYVDWLTCLGVVPVIRLSAPRKRKRDEDQTPRLDLFPAVSRPAADAVSRALRDRALQAAAALAERLELTRIPEYDRTALIWNARSREVVSVDLVTAASGRGLVLRPFSYIRGEVLFDSPLERLYVACARADRMREHGKICELINTQPVRVVLGRKPGDSDSAAQAAALVDGKDRARNDSSAAKLVGLIVRLQKMESPKDVAETLRAYLDDQDGRVLDAEQIDTSRVGFGQSRPAAVAAKKPPALTLREAFRENATAGVNRILEGHVHKQFETLSQYRETNASLRRELEGVKDRLRRADRRLFEEVPPGVESNPSVCRHGGPPDLECQAALSALSRDLIVQTADLSDRMAAAGSDSAVLNSFFSRFVPPYREEEAALSRLWEQELMRFFKLTRLTNNQGQELGVAYSNSAIDLIVEPYLSRVLRFTSLGHLVSSKDAYVSTDELFRLVFKRSRVNAYLEEIRERFLARVRRHAADVARGARSAERGEPGAGSAGADPGPLCSGMPSGNRDDRRF